jgi:S-adenosylmethionine:tRNA ribosyltransferase-isomerase
MKLDDFDFDLPEGLIATRPARPRSAARLLHADGPVTEDRHVHDLPAILRRGDRLVLNDTRVIPARLTGERMRLTPEGEVRAKIEVTLMEPQADGSWSALAKPLRKLKLGERVVFSDALSAEVLALEGGLRLRFNLTGPDFDAALNAAGAMPLPPYIERSADDPRRSSDNERYQTVYADYQKQVAVAAPTAGLHFTPELNAALESAGAQFHNLTLQIGIGTFHPVQTEHVEDHNIHREYYEIPASALNALQSDESLPRVAVGTTSVRSIEDALSRIPRDPGCLTPSGSVQAEADIYIYPPYQYKGVDHLITNFHLPKSTLLCLVSAFLTPGSEDGIDWLKELYAEAIAEQYRFYSYGDAMLIL